MKCFATVRNNQARGGFALPTILIASVVMLMVLVTAVSAVVVSRNALADQYYNRLAAEAAESGLAMAAACLDSGTTTWTDPLRPGGDCAGLASQGTAPEHYVLSTGSTRTTFTVTAPTTSNGTTTIQATGITERVRASNGGVWKRYEQSIKEAGSTAAATPAAGITDRYAAGSGTSCMTASNDVTYCWGSSNNLGQLGNGSDYSPAMTSGPISPGAIPSGVVLQTLAAGESHTCGIGSDAWAYCWGSNGASAGGRRLGIGTNDGWRNVPTAVVRGAIPVGQTITHLAGGYGHSCAVASNNRIYCWGRNTYGELGNGSTTSTNAPVLTSYGNIPTSATISKLVTGSTSCALTTAGVLYCWGQNNYGQLGDGTTTDRTTPRTVVTGAKPAATTVKDIDTKYSHACMVSSTDRVYCWGQNNHGQLGDGTTVNRSSPVQVALGARPGAQVNQLVVGNYFTCVLISFDFWPYCWGDSRGTGLLGNGSMTGSSSTPVAVARGQIPPGATVQRLFAGYEHMCALASDGELYCWGRNGSGELGDGTTTHRAAPQRVTALPAGGGSPAGSSRIVF